MLKKLTGPVPFRIFQDLLRRAYFDDFPLCQWCQDSLGLPASLENAARCTPSMIAPIKPPDIAILSVLLKRAAPAA